MSKLATDECAKAVERLTARQREVLALLTAGHPRKAIADSLGVNIATIGNHCEAIYARLGVSSVAQAVVIATKAGL